jgi:orotidine-5'-phosphate decarboxylase
MSQTSRAMIPAKDKLFVALDVDTEERALELVRTLSSCTRMFKVGPQLFTSAGPDIVRKINDSGARVFLDLKFHDIPNTVAAAAAAATRLGVFMFNVHAAGGREMMRRALEASSDVAAKNGTERPLMMGVTMLTSADASLLADIGVSRTMADQVTHLATMSAESGLDGVVASPHEVGLIRVGSAPHLLVLTPGIRPRDAALDDQKRVKTPAEAIKAGANYLVVGRPITAAPDPVRVARQIIDEIEG